MWRRGESKASLILRVSNSHHFHFFVFGNQNGEVAALAERTGNTGNICRSGIQLTLISYCFSYTQRIRIQDILIWIKEAWLLGPKTPFQYSWKDIRFLIAGVVHASFYSERRPWSRLFSCCVSSFKMHDFTLWCTCAFRMSHDNGTDTRSGGKDFKEDYKMGYSHSRLGACICIWSPPPCLFASINAGCLESQCDGRYLLYLYTVHTVEMQDLILPSQTSSWWCGEGRTPDWWFACVQRMDSDCIRSHYAAERLEVAGKEAAFRKSEGKINWCSEGTQSYLEWQRRMRLRGFDGGRHLFACNHTNNYIIYPQLVLFNPKLSTECSQNPNLRSLW